jgi:hypothetical protein
MKQLQLVLRQYCSRNRVDYEELNDNHYKGQNETFTEQKACALTFQPLGLRGDVLLVA